MRPSSRIRGVRPTSCENTSWAVLAFSSPKRLADVAANGPPLSKTARVTGDCSCAPRWLVEAPGFQAGQPGRRLYRSERQSGYPILARPALDPGHLDHQPAEFSVSMLDLELTVQIPDDEQTIHCQPRGNILDNLCFLSHNFCQADPSDNLHIGPNSVRMRATIPSTRDTWPKSRPDCKAWMILWPMACGGRYKLTRGSLAVRRYSASCQY